MNSKKLGALLIAIASLSFAAFRVSVLMNDFSWMNAAVGACEISILTLASIEASLMATATTKRARKQDDTVLMESAKTILFSSNAGSVSEQNGETKVKVDAASVSSSANFVSSNVDVVVFAQDSTLEQLRRCFLSINMLDDVDHVYLIDSKLSTERENLTKEFSFFVADSFHNIVATTERVLICRGTDILYPDAVKIGRTYDIDDSTFLELRSVYSDERALGINGVVDVTDKRQMIREALSTRGLSTWSTGPAIVPSSSLEFSAHATTSTQFFRSCEKHGIHGIITDEIMSEEISHEQTISEVEWRALDFSYSSGAWKHKYNSSGSRMIGLGVKTWSAMINASLVRRMATIALVLYCVTRPSSFNFVNITYIAAGFVTAIIIFTSGYLMGDKRGLFARIREFYFDIEAVMYNIYKSMIAPEQRAKDSSIVKKLPSVSVLLILTNATLVFRVYQQYNEQLDDSVNNFLKNFSLFSGYALLVTMLIGLGMVIVRQSRSAMRREVSRGANLDSEPIAMIDLSPGGAGCVSITSFEIGKEIEFESSLPTKNESVKFRCRAVVRSNVAWNDSYRVGIEFLEIDREQLDVLETYCSIVYPHAQAREVIDVQREKGAKIAKLNGKAEKRFLSYAASFIALGAIIFSNLSALQ